MPPEVICLLPLDDSVDPVQMQKRATPVATPGSVEEAVDHFDVETERGGE